LGSETVSQVAFMAAFVLKTLASVSIHDLGSSHGLRREGSRFGDLPFTI
jgi:hypothetical protein